jgi:hypothetical protein
LVGLGSYALLTSWGRKDNDVLVQCAPGCMQKSVDHVRRLYLAANISLGAGIAALGAATWLLLRSSVGSRTAEGATPRWSRHALEVIPLSAGAVATLRGAF